MFSCSYLFGFKKADYHVEESSGKKDSRIACGGKIKASKLRIKILERETHPHVGLGCVIQPSESQIGLEF